MASPAVTPDLETKLVQAATEAAQIADLFSPAVGQAIASGVAVEPLFSGLIKLFIGLFHHHAKQALVQPAK